MHKLILLILVLVTGCAAGDSVSAPVPASTELPPVSAVIITPEPSPLTASLDDQVSVYVDGLTENEKIGQLFCCAFRDITVFNEEINAALTNYKIGGVVLFAENMETEEQTKRLIEDLQKASSVPLFMAVDEEGGRVSRLSRIYGSAPPSAASIGETGDTLRAYDEASSIGRSLAGLGFNLDFAPVADINTNPKNTVIGDRAYGSDPVLVGEMVASAVAGLQDQGIGAVLKHFPGHGDTREDSHKGSATVNHDLNRLMEVELVPFLHGVEAGAVGVMAGHISAPNITDSREPAIFSSFLLRDILKNKINFNGIVFTDAMDMGAVTNYYTAGEAAFKAFEAGIDVIVMPESLEEAYGAIKEGLESGRLDREQLDKKVKKIIKTKYILGLLIEI